ncbi:MAG TPA: response regulator [Bacilli bacterium]|nr:response regulator [Bacilli bacterium]
MTPRYKVLIVDDGVLIRQGIIHYIDWDQEGFEIVGDVSNGQEALELLPKVMPDIIITDIVMPLMDGITLIETVKQDYANIDAIVLSSFDDYDYVRSTFKNGVSDYILKPKLDAALLLDTLRRVANQRSPHAQSNEMRQQNAIDSVQSLAEKLIAGYSPVAAAEQLATVLTKP